MGSEYEIFENRLSPQSFGVPNSRTRSVTWCVRKATLRMKQAWDIEYLRPFMAKPAAEFDGQSFFVAPSEEIEAHHFKSRRNHTHQIGVDSVESVAPESLLGPGAVVRLAVHEAEARRKRGIEPDVPFAGLVDSRQTSARGVVVTHMPALLTASRPWSFLHLRELLPKESLLVMGIPVYKHVLPESRQHQYCCPFQTLLPGIDVESSVDFDELRLSRSRSKKEMLTDAAIRRLAGNAFSAPVIGTAFVSALALVIPKS